MMPLASDPPRSAATRPSNPTAPGRLVGTVVGTAKPLEVERLAWPLALALALPLRVEEAALLDEACVQDPDCALVIAAPVV